MAGSGKWAATGQVLGALAAAALLGGAVHVAAKNIDLATLWAADPILVLGLLLAMIVNLVTTGALFWSITRTFDADPPVRLGPMVALITASSLLNYLPLRPGMLGRAAYLKLQHKLPFAQSFVIAMVVTGLSAWVLGVATLAVVVAPPDSQGWALIAGMLLLLVLAPLTLAVGRRLLRRPIVAGWQWVVLRIVDMLLVGGRLWLAFRIVDAPIGYSQAVAIAAAGTFVSATGLTPNGLGLREWVVGALAGVVSPVQAGTGLAASLVDRAAEALVNVVLGLPALLRLRRQAARPLMADALQSLRQGLSNTPQERL